MCLDTERVQRHMVAKINFSCELMEEIYFNDAYCTFLLIRLYHMIHLSLIYRGELKNGTFWLVEKLGLWRFVERSRNRPG